ncbi:MAG: type II toxin-antitoxin system Phd/YefM family antitoxin [Elusimicrobia bacterium]|nr:type II toxin-antitoxin system Phd/YefM family antitoxin [Elusimicrobiota bacterium]
MKMISVRDLRAKSAQIWRDLAREKEMVITSKGKPVGVLSSTSEETLEESLAVIRRARAMLGVLSLQLKSTREGRDKISLDDINAEIAAVRKPRSK